MKASQGQSFLDIVIQSTGSLDYALEMACLNTRSMTEDVPIGTVLKVSQAKNTKIVALFDQKNKPATAVLDFIIEDYGIGKMTIGRDFKIK